MVVVEEERIFLGGPKKTRGDGQKECRKKIKKPLRKFGGYQIFRLFYLFSNGLAITTGATLIYSPGRSSSSMVPCSDSNFSIDSDTSCAK